MPNLEYNVTVDSEALISTTYNLTLYTWCRIKRCCYKRAWMYCN